MKEMHPVETAEYAVDQEIYHEPAFNWWVNAVLKKRLQIISLIKKKNSHYLKKTHNFGIEVPKSFAQEYSLDEKNGDTLWADAIAKDMKDMIPAFRKLDNEEIVPIGYQRENCHIIFDVKMEDFRRKARLVSGGQVTELPATINHARVVSREKVRITLTLADLNDFSMKVAYIKNSYMKAPVTEKIWTVLVREFDEDDGRKAIVVCALCGFKSDRAIF